MGTTPGADAIWGPNLWLVRVDGRLELAGDGHRPGVQLDAPDVRALLAASARREVGTDLRPAVAEALAGRGWAPEPRPRDEPAERGAPADVARLAPDPGFPLLIRVRDGRATVWDDARQAFGTVGADELAALAGPARRVPSVPPQPSPREVAARLLEHAQEPPASSPPVPRMGRVPVWFATSAQPGDGSPLALGMISAAIRAFENGRLLTTYAARPIQVEAEPVLRDVIDLARPGILLASNYDWTLAENLELAEAVKQLAPGSITVFGGPSAPKYEADAEAFLAAHPQVDVIVRGEGEVTAAELLAALDGDLSELKPLSGVPGLTFRHEGRVVRTPDRERMADVNQVPSPYLMGLFDHLTHINGIWALETNRGCPYGCTFCDWGSATLSRVRLFDLDRVLAEIDWFAEHGVQAVFVADANFGMFARDIEISQHVVDQKARFGSPGFIIATFAKNTTKHTLPIVERFVEAGLASEATLSFQTTDETVLGNIRRRNVKMQVYEDLAADARERAIPVLSDLMFALPGSDLETFKADLQVCFEGDVTTRAFGTIVLPNSPMNDPEYRREFGIETDSAGQLVACSTFTRAEREEMVRFRDVHRLADHFGVLREVMRYIASETEVPAVEVLWRIYEVATSDPVSYPLAGWFLLSGRRYLTVPMGWGPFFQEIRSIATTHLGVADDEALTTALRVQELLLPSPGRSFPHEVELAHDYVAFRDQTRGPAPAEGLRPLRSFGPGSLAIDDPNALSDRAFGENLDLFLTPEGGRKLFSEGGFMGDQNWELVSPLARPMRGGYY